MVIDQAVVVVEVILIIHQIHNLVVTESELKKLLLQLLVIHIHIVICMSVVQVNLVVNQELKIILKHLH